MFADGSNGSIEVVGDSIVIRRKGFANLLTQGVQGDKQVPIRNITAVQFRSAGSMMAGLIQFTLVGGREFRGGMLEATKDENAVMFTREQEEAFVALRDYIQQCISAPTGISVGSSPVEEFERLAALHEKGHLTAEEFSEAKKRALAAPSPPTAVPQRPSTPSNAPNAEPTVAKGGCLKTIGFVVLAVVGLRFYSRYS